MDPAAKCRHNITQNKQLIFGCIQYEIAKGNEAYTAYKNISKNLGPDVITYKEFDYFYHRFIRGNFDLNFNWSTESSKLELSDLPIELISESILGKLGWNDRLNMKKVSRSLRAQVSGMTGRTLKEVDLKIYTLDRVDVTVNGELRAFSTSGFEQEWNYDEKWEPIECFGGLNEALGHLIGVLRDPGVKVHHFSVYISDLPLELLLSTIEDAFKQLKSWIPVRRCSVQVDTEAEMMPFLLWMEPGALEKLYSFNRIPVKELLNTEQWKQCKELDVYGMEIPTEHLLHFTRYENFIEELDKDTLLRYKNAFFANPDFEFCRLLYEYDVQANAHHLEATLGPDRVFKPDTGKTFVIKYEPTAVVFKHNNHFDFVSLNIVGNEKAQLKLNEELIEYENGIIDEYKKIGNWREALAHLAMVWRTPLVDIDHLSIEFHSTGDNIDEVVEALKALFVSFGYMISVDSLCLFIESEAQLLAILPYVEPETLKKIHIRGNENFEVNEHGQAKNLRIENGLETDQWMKAETLDVAHVELPYKCLHHFRHCTVFFHESREDEILKIRNDFFACSLGLSFTLCFRDPYDEKRMKALLEPTRLVIPDRFWTRTFTIEFESSAIHFKLNKRHI